MDGVDAKKHKHTKESAEGAEGALLKEAKATIADIDKGMMGEIKSRYDKSLLKEIKEAKIAILDKELIKGMKKQEELANLNELIERAGLKELIQQAKEMDTKQQIDTGRAFTNERPSRFIPPEFRGRFSMAENDAARLMKLLGQPERSVGEIRGAADSYVKSMDKALALLGEWGEKQNEKLVDQASADMDVAGVSGLKGVYRDLCSKAGAGVSFAGSSFPVREEFYAKMPPEEKASRDKGIKHYGLESYAVNPGENKGRRPQELTPLEKAKLDYIEGVVYKVGSEIDEQKLLIIEAKHVVDGIRSAIKELDAAAGTAGEADAIGALKAATSKQRFWVRFTGTAEGEKGDVVDVSAAGALYILEEFMNPSRAPLMADVINAKHLRAVMLEAQAAEEAEGRAPAPTSAET
jgi:hypothetical protein